MSHKIPRPAVNRPDRTWRRGIALRYRCHVNDWERQSAQPYAFGVKVSLAITGRHGLIVGARAFPGNPYDGHVLAEQLEQTAILLQEVQDPPGVKTVLTDLGYRGVDADIAPVQLVHRGKSRTLSTRQRRWLKGKTGDAVHAVLRCRL